MASSDIAAHLRPQLSQFIAAQFGDDATADAIRDGVLAHAGLASLDRGDLLAALDDVLASRVAKPIVWSARAENAVPTQARRHATNGWKERIGRRSAVTAGA